MCTNPKQFKPLGEEKLLTIFESAKSTNAEYDALVPISGGKDSTYILHLAVNVYKLNVLTMTYDNGLLSDIALQNIESAIKATGVKHVFSRTNSMVQNKIYRHTFLHAGDICGACDIATKAHIFKVAQDHKTPIILLGTSPLENDSFVPDSIQDIERFKYIMKSADGIAKKEIKEFLIYPNLNLLRLSYYKHTGRFAKEVQPLFYIDNPTDRQMGEIITEHMGWREDKSREYSKHFDCIAEPLTNYVRNKIYGYDRRVCQYSNMIRYNEITREKASELFRTDNIESKPVNYQRVLSQLNLTDENLDAIVKNSPMKFEKHTSKMNKFFAILMKIKMRIKG